MATVAVRFVFPAVSAEGAAFWIIRTSPITLRDFLWSKFWTGARAGAGADRGADDRRQRVPRRRSVPEGRRARSRSCFMTLRAGRPRRRPRRPLSAVRRRPEPGRRLVRRRRVHDAGGAVRHRDDRRWSAGPVGRICCSRCAAGSAARIAATAHGRLLRIRGDPQRHDLARVDAVGSRCLKR